MAVRYYNDSHPFQLPQKRLISRWLKAVAEAEGYRLDEVNYIFCSSEKHREMNLQFVGHDYFTDIITFDYGNRREGWVAGEVFIDVETVRDNARIYHTSFRREMCRVVVHGVLHLCGQKDKGPRQERTMHLKEDQYLALLEQMRSEV